MKKTLKVLLILLIFISAEVYAENESVSEKTLDESTSQVESLSPQSESETKEIENNTKSESNNSDFVKNINGSVEYIAHVAGPGWLSYVKDGELAGTTGQWRRMEGIKIKLNSNIPGNIEYAAHVADYGWLPYVKNNALAGTTGQWRRMEAIKIKLTGEISNYYDIEYCAHGADYGWQTCVKNNEVAGTTGKYLRMEGIRIRLVPKTSIIDVKYKGYVDKKWQDEVGDGKQAGTTGLWKAIQGMKISLQNNSGIDGNIFYSTYKQNIWSDYKAGGTEVIDTDNQFEAIKIKLTGELAEYYDVYYRVHTSDFGWLDWQKNDGIAGTIGYHKRIEAYQVKLVYKKNAFWNVGKNPLRELLNRINYSSHVADYGWLNYVNEGQTSGTTGESRRMEAIKIKLVGDLSGAVNYQTYVVNEGWQKEVTNNQISGTTGKWRGIEAIKIRLTGNVSNEYDIYYRTSNTKLGWLSWTKNGEVSGSIGNDTTIEAIEIKLALKGTNPNLDFSKPLVKGSFKTNNGITSYYDTFGNLATGFKYIDGVKYYFDGTGKMMAKNAKKVIDVSSWQNDINWSIISDRKDVDAAIIRVGWGKSYTDPCGNDSYFDKNIKGVKAYNIPYAVYIYGYAKADYAAEAEAQCVIDKMKKYNLPKSTYVYYDAEISSIPRSTYEVVIPKFVNKMHANGYNNVGVYGNLNMLDSANGTLNSPKIKQYPIWIAQYYKKLQYSGEYIGWQFTSGGIVEGINGHVDVSMFK